MSTDLEKISLQSANMDLHEKLRRTLMSLEMALRDNGNLSRYLPIETMLDNFFMLINCCD